ncbi:MAG: hypothetical protein ACBZ72_05600 [Candidatus Bathyarchaeia archaeon]|jgi:hypothetical protein
MQVKKIAVLTIICTLALAAAASMAFAAPIEAQTASVITQDAAGVPKNQFNHGETVYVKLVSTAPDGSVADITILDSDGNVVAGPWMAQSAGSINSFVPPTSGYYFVNVNGQPVFTIAVATLFVLPESVFGTLAAVGAAFAAFGTIAIVKKKQK